MQCNQTTLDREDTECLGRARLAVVDTNSGDLPSEALPEGPASAALWSSFIGHFIVVSVIVALAAPSWYLADLRLIHTIPDTTCLPMARAFLLSLWIWNVPWLRTIVSERSKDSDPVCSTPPN